QQRLVPWHYRVGRCRGRVSVRGAKCKKRSAHECERGPWSQHGYLLQLRLVLVMAGRERLPRQACPVKVETSTPKGLFHRGSGRVAARAALSNQRPRTRLSARSRVREPPGKRSASNASSASRSSPASIAAAR